MQYVLKQETLPDRVYEGFSHWTSGAEVIAVATFEGEADLYAVESGREVRAKIEIERLYKDDYDRGPELLTIYRKVED